MSVLATDEPLTAKIRTTFILDDNKNSGYTTFCVPQGLGVMKQNLVDYSDEYQGAKVKFIACRWSKKEDKPIIDFVMDNQFPELWKKAIYKGADIWNKGFEKAGIARTAVSIKENGFDKSDNSLTQNRIRYAVTPLNDIRGSIWVRPNTGEIFNADIVINHDIINNIQIEAFLTLSPYLPQARTLVPDDSLFVNMLAQRVAFNIGKCLGFEENFKASSIYPVDSLSSAAFTQNNGIVASIMDNTNFNYVAGEEGIKSGAKLFQDRAGEIDILNIKYLYGDYKVYEDTIYNSCKLFSEAPVLGNSYIFGSKKSLNGFIDPESLNSDLGDNQIKSSTIGLETLQKVVENGA